MEMSMFKDIPVDVGVIYEGERVRRNDMYVELGGPKQEHKFELVKTKSLDDVEDERITVTGPDIKDMEEGSTHPLGIYVEVAGKSVEEDLEGVIERRIHEYSNYIEGFMHLNQRYDIWLRLNKKSFQKGLNSFGIIGKVLLRLFKSELTFIEKIQITFITDPGKIRKMWKEAMETYEARDAKARGMKDEDADAFYGCTLCQSFAPTHCCVITPQRYANCGAISWFDGRASARVDPKGPIFSIDKGECIDPFKGEYTGANATLKEKTLGEVTQVWLYTAFNYPHTSCGCFEGIAFYIPEVDGLGIVHRAFEGTTVNGLPFSTMADSTAGGRQVDGFHGISIEYMRSPKFLQVDGGWNRVVWIPATIKERVRDFIPKEVIDKIATENDVKIVDELKAFLEKKKHPVVERWKAAPVEVVPEVTEEAPLVAPVLVSAVSAGGFKIILKDAKIHAKKVIIRATEEK
jgi:acetyl-CoA decarbonylase/synthase complex subunit beta